MAPNSVIVSPRSAAKTIPIEDRPGEAMMLVADILHSCTDEGVAEAAVASIGGDFADALRTESLRLGVTVGALTVSLVSRFAIDATERDWRRLTAALVGEDHPVLSGLRIMAEGMLLRGSAPAPVLRRDRIVTSPALAAPVSLCSLA